jgi:hypothetical protein
VLLLSEAGAEAERYDLVVTFTRRRAAPDLTYRLEVAADCPGAWLAAAGFVSEDAVTDDGNGVTETVRCYLRSPAPDRSRGFVRLRLEKRP